MGCYYGKEGKVTRKKLDANGRIVIDPKTEKAAIETDRYPGLAATYLNELLMLHNVLREADRIELADAGGDRFRPQAERTTRRIAAACAAEGWSTTRLWAKIKKAKDPAPRSGAGQRKPQSPIQLTAEKCVLDLRAMAHAGFDARASSPSFAAHGRAVCRIRDGRREVAG